VNERLIAYRCGDAYIAGELHFSFAVGNLRKTYNRRRNV
jgi:hypothetical protein